MDRDFLTLVDDGLRALWDHDPIAATFAGEPAWASALPRADAAAEVEALQRQAALDARLAAISVPDDPRRGSTHGTCTRSARLRQARTRGARAIAIPPGTRAKRRSALFRCCCLQVMVATLTLLQILAVTKTIRTSAMLITLISFVMLLMPVLLILLTTHRCSPQRSRLALRRCRSSSTPVGWRSKT